MSELFVESCETTSSEKPKFRIETSGSRGGLIGSIHWILPSQDIDTTSWAPVGTTEYSPLIPMDIEADKLRYSFLADEFNGEIAVDLDNFRRTVATLLGKLREVKAVYIFPHDDCYEVYTVLGTRDRRVRNRLFEKELAIHDLFPEALLDFKVSMSPTLPTSKDLPKNAIKCFSR